MHMEDRRRVQISQLQYELERVQTDLQVTELPPEVTAASKELRTALSQTTKEWFQFFCDEGYEERLAESLPDRWILLLGDPEGHYDAWFEAEFMQWGQDDLPDVIADFLDGRAESLVDDAFCELVSLFPRFDLMQKRTFCLPS